MEIDAVFVFVFIFLHVVFRLHKQVIEKKKVSFVCFAQLLVHQCVGSDFEQSI